MHLKCGSTKGWFIDSHHVSQRPILVFKHIFEQMFFWNPESFNRTLDWQQKVCSKVQFEPFISLWHIISTLKKYSTSNCVWRMSIHKSISVKKVLKVFSYSTDEQHTQCYFKMRWQQSFRACIYGHKSWLKGSYAEQQTVVHCTKAGCFDPFSSPNTLPLFLL